MKDALFQGYGGAAHTHSSGGGLLKPGDFHGQAALLIKENVTGDERNQQKALRRLKHPLVGNEIVRQTLTCLEREIACAQPTIPNGLKKHTGSGSDSDEDEASVLLQPEEFSGAAVSMLPPGEGAESVFNEPPMIGTTTSRVGNHTVLKEADPISASSTAEAATFPTLYTMGTTGGFAHTQTGCTKNHYIHKTLGSVATHFCRAQEVKRQAPTHHTLHVPQLLCSLCSRDASQFVWFHFQDKVKCSTFGKSARPMVSGQIATEASTATLSEHKSDVEKQWDLISQWVCAPHNCLFSVLSSTHNVLAPRSTQTSSRTAPCKSLTQDMSQRQWLVPKPTGETANLYLLSYSVSEPIRVAKAPHVSN